MTALLTTRPVADLRPHVLSGRRYIPSPRTTSWAAARARDLLRDGGWDTADVVFLDARKRYEDEFDYIAEWLPRVRPGGCLAGHDYSSVYMGIVEVAFGCAWGGRSAKDVAEEDLVFLGVSAPPPGETPK